MSSKQRISLISNSSNNIINHNDFIGITLDNPELKYILDTNIDLLIYSDELDQKLYNNQNIILDEFIEHSKEIEQFNNALDQCDNMLLTMNNTLTNFQSHLGSICNEISNLQEKSININMYLKNRKSALLELGPKIKIFYLSPELITSLWSYDINEAYMSLLYEFHIKLLNLPSQADITCVKYELEPIFQVLKDKVIHKLRNFLFSKIHSLRIPNTNMQIKQEILLKCNFSIEFLKLYSMDVANEIEEHYIDSISQEYFINFKNYIDNSMTLVIPSDITQTDLLGSEVESGFFTSSAVNEARLFKSFQLGNRPSLIQNYDSDPILFHVYKANSKALKFEELFRSVLKLLCDTVTSESGFYKKFFYSNLYDNSLPSPTKDAVTENDGRTKADVEMYFQRIFKPTMNYIKHHKRRISYLSWFCDQLLLSLWPVFKSIINNHLYSIRTTNSSSLSTKLNVLKPQTQVLSRYVELINSLNYFETIEALDKMDKSLILAQRSLSQEIESYFIRLSSSIMNPKLISVFLIHNYDYILTSLSARNIHTDTTTRFAELLNSQMIMFVEEELTDSNSNATFAPFISFLKNAENGSSMTEKYTLDATNAETILRNFSISWKDGLITLIQNISKYFNPDRDSVAEQVLKQTLTQLLLYYQRFHELIKKYFKDNSHVVKELVPLHTIMFEMKKFVNKF